MVKTKLFFPSLLLAAALLLSVSLGIARASTFGTVQGKVSDAAGKPVAGVKINLPGAGSVTTDKSGSYTLDGIDPGEYHLEAAKKGYQKSSVTVTIVQDVPQEVDITLNAAS